MAGWHSIRRRTAWRSLPWKITDASQWRETIIPIVRLKKNWAWSLHDAEYVLYSICLPPLSGGGDELGILPFFCHSGENKGPHGHLYIPLFVLKPLVGKGGPAHPLSAIFVFISPRMIQIRYNSRQVENGWPSEETQKFALCDYSMDGIFAGSMGLAPFHRRFL